MPTYYGVVKGQTVILSPEARVVEGSTVEVHVPDGAVLLAAKQALLAAGLISTIRMPGRDLPPHRRGQPISTAGRPASEVLIEERC